MRAPAYGIFARIAFSYWEAGTLPAMDDCGLVALGNADMGTLNRHRKAIEFCLGLVMPELEALYLKSIRKAAKIRFNASLGGKARQAALKRRAIEQVKSIMLSDGNKDRVVTEPTAPPLTSWSKERASHDFVLASKAVKNNKKDDGTKLSDKKPNR